MASLIRVLTWMGIVSGVCLSGCSIMNICGCSAKETYSRTVELSEPMATGSSLKVRTANGSITTQGQETPTCSITAEVTGRASTKERAQELAEQTQVQLEPCDGGLQTVVIAPKKEKKESICVSFDVTMPDGASLDAVTTNGEIQVASLTGDLVVRTTNGSIKCSQIRANRIEAHTANGSVTCEDVTGAMNTQTTNGSVRVAYASQADSATNISISTTNGNVTITLPKDSSSKIDASTVNGRVKTDIPVTVSGRITKNSLNGTIGTGDGKLSLRTVNGSINIR